MSEARIDFIKEQLAAGKSADEIRREAISQGHGTDGFDDDFAAASGAGVPVPVAPSVEAQVVPDAAPAANTAVMPEVVPEASVPPTGSGFIGAVDLLKESFSIAKDNLKLVGGFVVAVLGLLVIGGLFLGAVLLTAGMTAGGGVLSLLIGIVLYLVWLIGFVVATTGLVYAFIKRREGVGYWAGVSWCFRHFWHIFWIALLIQLITSGGYLFLLIPGLVVGLYTSFAMFVFISEGEKGFSALLRSTQLVYGNWWGVVGRVLLFLLVLLAAGLGLGLAAGIFSMLLGAISGTLAAVLMVSVFAVFYMFLIGWGISLSVVMMESLQSFKPKTGELWDTMKTTRIIYIILAVIGIPMMFILQGASFSDMTGGTAGTDADWYLEDDSFGSDWEAELERSIQEQIQLELEAQS